jgi:hypothetical protein
MEKSYRVILIDPEARSITELQSDASLKSIHELVGADGLDHIGVAKYDQQGGGFDFMWVDDFGLARGKPIHAFKLPIQKDPLVGRCVVIGADDRGKTCSCRFPIEMLRRDVEWLGLILPEVIWDKTEHGNRAIVTYSRVKA